jgi:hypothetical protein
MIAKVVWLKPEEKAYFHQISLDCMEKLIKCLERFNKGEIWFDIDKYKNKRIESFVNRLGLITFLKGDVKKYKILSFYT